MTRNQALGLIDRLRILLFVKVDIFVNIFSFLKDLNDYEEFKSIRCSNVYRDILDPITTDEDIAIVYLHAAKLDFY